MAKRGTKKSTTKKDTGLDLTKLSKGYLRKLTALRKSLGEEIADSAFVKWMTSQPARGGTTGDKNAQAISDLLTPAAIKGSFRIPRGGYVIRRGRGRVIVQAASEE